ncbi:MAG: TRAP transporter large permease [Geminicoccaceae bacterium]
MLIVVILAMLALLFLSLPVAAALTYLGFFLDGFYSNLPLHRGLATMSWAVQSGILLVAVPMFILLGEILVRSGVAERMYRAMMQWLSWLPGGLMHANIGASIAISATAGSSVATAATVSTVSVPLVRRYRYNEPLFLGSLAAGGTLGILIPPSINLIIFGFLTNTSIPALYLAGFIPGLVLGGLFMLTILVACLIRPAWGGEAVSTSWRERVRSLPDLLPPLGIFVLVIGSIYAGWATPTESASLGVCAALVVAAMFRRLSASMLREAILGTMRTTGLIFLILIGAWFLNFVLSAIGVNRMLTDFITEQGLTPFRTLLLVIAFYVVVGTVMEPMPMMVITVPTLTPLMAAAGFDPVWFGILVVLMCETALISPPVGANLFVVQGTRGRGSINDVFIGVTPFVIALFVIVALIIVFPEIVLWLPAKLG